MNKFSEEGREEIREIVRDEIAILGLPAGLTIIARACIMVARWAQKTKKKLEKKEGE